ncbi:MAG: N-acetylmuramoyl-L-alanine amidase [Rhodospirillaceae bacterium]|jgi:N-acetylmuramoyl-L-alanine amidase|nr:N-acetylmuramoyl-L-alanine amidase [Rhodospirillaceae bacterium]MBT5297303.1 N-acetylmuramoyl-L-alanine amidase [Rhodospirillaceae bacterium]MBT6607077.1 N-acetylmuramoyl-L-alanine amidase [Rhodospirillaceae bacterium]MBT6884342.1 N-acetylmuramoyl-L-alanine amidase [Rhodospirillaceae bacterium]MBT7248982.1 N-acetylmuramoyl-L-alanine amidase [Rhodospirillaceae bacterium]
MIETPSPNFNDRPDGVFADMLVFHYTGMASGQAALDRLCDPVAEVSAHYLIDEDGAVHRLVDEQYRAWHAGVAHWRGETNINDRSIGIELVNPGHEFDYRAFPEPQVAALKELALGILARHDIPARNVVGHSDVAPARKIDPGELFDWVGMAQAGIGLWPANEVEPSDDVDYDSGQMLTKIGYDISDLPAAVTAFQRHFYAERLDGIADAATLRRLAAVVALI